MFLVDALAAYRLTRLVVQDDFPPVARARDLVKEAAGPTSSVTQMLECPWCSGFWVSALVVAARGWLPRVWAPAASALALSAVTGIVTQALED